MLNDGYTYHDRITSLEAGEVVIDYYARRHAHSTKEEWLGHITAGRIERNDEAVSDPGTVLRAGDRLAWHRPAWEEEDVPTCSPVLADGDGWIVLDKPSGLPVLPGGGFLENTLLRLARASHGPLLSPVHRLGRGTSGAILFSCSTQAARMLAAAMRDGAIRKTYLALVRGCPIEDRFTVDVPIGPVDYAPLGRLHAASPDGKPSLSHCRVLRRDQVRVQSLLEIDIPTGRPHQIRIHCAAAGYPLVGDPLYGAGGLPTHTGAVPGDCGYFLHSWQIRFPDPSTSEIMHVVATPPVILRPEF